MLKLKNEWNLELPESNGKDVLVQDIEINKDDVMFRGTKVKFEIISSPDKSKGVYKVSVQSPDGLKTTLTIKRGQLKKYFRKGLGLV